jgi:predicted DNA-binding WGR domain protein
MKRYFEFIGKDAKTKVESSKFWEVWVDDTTLRTRYGKIGANGQTTLKSFGSKAEAEAAEVKAIAEKTKKGYVEKGGEASKVSESKSTSSISQDENAEVIAAKKLFTKWAKKYKPVAFVNVELDELPDGISDNLVWSLSDFGDSCSLISGFSPTDYSSRIPVLGHVITSVPFEDGNEYDSVTTELTIYCEACDAEGTLDDEDCPHCEGDGNLYVDTAGEYPLIISTQEELDSFLAAATPQRAHSPKGTSSGNAAKFCSECGSKREPISAKFCSECGSSF